MAIIEYSGARTDLGPIRTALAKALGLFGARPYGSMYLEEKKFPYPLVNSIYLPNPTWRVQNTKAYFLEGYRLNSAMFAIVRTLAQAFAEPPMRVYSDDTKKKQEPKHPLQLLLKRPNQWTGEDEHWKNLITCACVGGNAYDYIVPTNGGTPAELYLFSDLHITPQPGTDKLVDHYDYSADEGLHKYIIDPAQIVHFKYAYDPLYPWKGMGAAMAVAREVDSDNELTRFLKALIQNDAVPGTIITLPPTSNLTDEQIRALKSNFDSLYGGDRRGKTGVLTGGATITKAALSLQELELDKVRATPEARVAAVFGVPAIVAGLNIGLARSTYSNFEEARKAFAEQTLIPLWKAVASEVQNSLVPLFGNDCYVDFDISQVRALTENLEVRLRWFVAAYQAKILNQNEVRAEFGKDPLPDGDNTFYQGPDPAAIPGTTAAPTQAPQQGPDMNTRNPNPPTDQPRSVPQKPVQAPPRQGSKA